MSTYKFTEAQVTPGELRNYFEKIKDAFEKNNLTIQITQQELVLILAAHQNKNEFTYKLQPYKGEELANKLSKFLFEMVSLARKQTRPSYSSLFDETSQH